MQEQYRLQDRIVLPLHLLVLFLVMLLRFLSSMPQLSLLLPPQSSFTIDVVAFAEEEDVKNVSGDVELPLVKTYLWRRDLDTWIYVVILSWEQRTLHKL